MMLTRAFSWFSVSTAVGLLVLSHAAAMLWLTSRFSSDAIIAFALAAAALLWAAPLVVEQGLGKFRRLLGKLQASHALWLILLLSGLVFRLRGVDAIADGAVDAWAVYRAGLVGVVALGVGIWLFSEHVPLRGIVAGLLFPLTAYALVSSVSVIWSVAPAWTLYKSAEYLTALVLTALLVWRLQGFESLKTLLDWTWLLHGALLSTVWLGMVLFPDAAIRYGRSFGMLGFAINGVAPAIGWNTVGELSAVLAAVCFCRVFFRRAGASRGAFYWAGLFAGGVTLLLSASRSSIAGLFVGIAAATFAARRFRLLAAAGLVSVIVGQSALGDLALRYFHRNQDLATFYSFSGRMQLWEFGLEQLSAAPWTGFGAYAGGRFVALADFNRGTRAGGSSVLNTYLEVLLGSSLWGLIPLLAALIGTWWCLWHAARRLPPDSLPRESALEAIAALGVITVRSWFTVKLVWHPALLFLAVLACAEFLRRSCPRRA